MNLADTNLPLVSIVAVNYNNSKYVLETLNGIAAQTYPNIELIIVDDCSTDDSIQKIEEWLTNYSKPFQLVQSPRNQGVCATFNKGYRIATGKYISSTATDDKFLPTKIQNQVCFFESLPTDVGMIFSDAYLIDDDSNQMFGTFIQKFRKFDYVPSGDIFDALVKGNFIPAMATMIKTSIFESVGYFDEDLPYEDYDMWLRIAKKYKIVFQNHIGAVYRKRKESLTSSFKSGEWVCNALKILAKHKELESVRKQMAILITELYFENYQCKEILNHYNILNNGIYE